MRLIWRKRMLVTKGRRSILVGNIDNSAGENVSDEIQNIAIMEKLNELFFKSVFNELMCESAYRIAKKIRKKELEGNSTYHFELSVTVKKGLDYDTYF